MSPYVLVLGVQIIAGCYRPRRLSGVSSFFLFLSLSPSSSSSSSSYSSSSFP